MSTDTNDQTEPDLHGKQYITPRRKNVIPVREALETEPENGMSFDGIIN
jgi:hypothetical protein